MQVNLLRMRQLEETMNALCNAAYALCDANTMKKANDLRYLVAEMRVLASNPTDSEHVERFTSLFTGE